MFRSRLIGIVAGSVGTGRRCTYCRDQILWVTTISEKGKPARILPFNSPRPWPLRVERNDETGVCFEWWPTTSRHVCAKRPTLPKTFRRASDPSDVGHDRIYRGLALE